MILLSLCDNHDSGTCILKDGEFLFAVNEERLSRKKLRSGFSRMPIGECLRRTGIETFLQDIKQHLGFGEVFMRSWSEVQTRWTLVGITYNPIALWNGNKARSFRQMIRHLRDSVDPNAVLYL